MKSFLYELAEKLYREHPEPETVTLVFPNRRASLYFRKYLSQVIDKPTFSPKLITVEEFISAYSPLTSLDKLELIHRLYKAYQVITKTAEVFDRFYFWGEMLIRDFDEVDKYMVNAELLFKDLSNQKELDSQFDFLTEEQLEFLKSFWGNFDLNDGANKHRTIIEDDVFIGSLIGAFFSLITFYLFEKIKSKNGLENALFKRNQA